MSSVPNTTEQNKTVSHVLGEITWLMSQSPVHKQMFISDLEWFAMPAILIEQFRIFNGPQSPVAVAFWANVTSETDTRLREGAFKLRPDEWRGGNIPWLIELISPFGGQEEIFKDLFGSVFDQKPFNYHTVDECGQRVVGRFEMPL